MSIYIRRVSYQTSSALNDQNNSQACLTVSPNKVIFDQLELNRINIAKLILKNQTKLEINFNIVQPKETFIRIRYHRTVIPPEGTLQVFAFLNPQGISKNVNDQFIITVGRDFSVHVPVIVAAAHSNLPRLRNSSIFLAKSKENLNPNKANFRNRVIMRCERRKNNHFMGVKQDSEVLNEIIESYLEKYGKIQGFLKQKTIKNEVFIGEKAISREKNLSIANFNLRMQYIAGEEEKNKIITRYEQEFSQEGPSIQHFKQIKPRWDFSLNQPKITFRKAMTKFTEQVRKIVIEYRFRKMHRVMHIYRQLDDQLNTTKIQSIIIRNLFEEDQQFQEEENSEDEEQRMVKKQEYLCRKIRKNISNKTECQLGIDFNEFTLAPRLLEQSYCSDVSNQSYFFYIKPMAGFDNWVSSEELKPYTHEEMKYKRFKPLNVWECLPRPQPENLCDFKKERFQNFRMAPLSQERRMERQIFAQIQEANCSKFRSYHPLSDQIDFSDVRTQDYSPAINHNYSQGIETIKHQRQFFDSFFTNGQQITLEGFPQVDPELISQPSRDDIIDFDELDRLTRLKLERLSQVPRHSNQLVERTRQKGKRDDFCTIYANLLQNIQKIKQKKLNISFNKILSFNRFILKKDHTLYF